MSIKELTENLETKEGLLNLISQVIKECPNDQDLGEQIRSNFKGYLENEQ